MFATGGIQVEGYRMDLQGYGSGVNGVHSGEFGNVIATHSNPLSTNPIGIHNHSLGNSGSTLGHSANGNLGGTKTYCGWNNLPNSGNQVTSNPGMARTDGCGDGTGGRAPATSGENTRFNMVNQPGGNQGFTQSYGNGANPGLLYSNTNTAFGYVVCHGII